MDAVKVEQLLKSYHAMKRSLDNLMFEIERFSGLSCDQVIEALTFTNPDGDRVQNNSVADKSGRIALIYRDVATRQNEELLRELLEQYHRQKNELDILEYRIALLDKVLEGVITDMFIAGLSWSDLCNKYAISNTTLGRYRKKGIAELSRLYARG